MRIHNRQLVTKNSARIVLMRGSEEFALTVVPLPMGWTELMMEYEVGIMPSPPQIPVRDGNGRVLRDDDGSIAMQADSSDPAFVKAYQRWNSRITALQFAAHLRDDAEVEFDSQPPKDDNGKKWKKHADDLHAEIVAAGFTDDEVRHVCREAERLSVRPKIEAATKLFSPTPNQDSDQPEANEKAC